MNLQRLGLSMCLLCLLCSLFGSGCSQTSIASPTSTRMPVLIPTESSTPTTSSMDSYDRGDINLAHLNFLVEDVAIAGQPMAITHIYSEYPRYEWVDASGEGIACIDDAARAALVYLDDFEHTHDPNSLGKAQRLLNFVRYMQAEDGQFYNFILDRAGTINTNGNTSFKSDGWWAARAGRALGEGYRVMRSVDPDYAVLLDQAFQRIFNVWSREVAQSYGKYNQVHGVSVPAWLIAGGSDVTSIVVLALLDYDRAKGGQDAPTRDLLVKLCEALSEYQAGNQLNYPFAWHPDSATSPFTWHAWGSTQVFALARAGQQLGHPEWVASAKREADTFYARLLAGQMVGEWGVLPFSFPQIAYGVDSMTQGLLALEQATGDANYGMFAGLAAGWFYGNNAAGFPMYDPSSGRGYDGLLGPTSFRVNRNAGAESTIEALMAIQAVSSDPVASRYLNYLPATGNTWQVLEAENAQQTRGDPLQSYHAAEGTGEARWSNGHFISLGSHDSFVQEFTLSEAGFYHLYIAYLRQGQVQESLSVEAAKVPFPPTIDGELNEWGVTQPLSVTTTANILRGAAGWGGPESDAFIGYLMWDDQYLYIAARVLSPSHRQTETGPSVWKGDALWIYLNPHLERSTLQDKLTFAQTPQGPQVWDWKAGRYLPGAILAWLQGDGFYSYEAALPWKSLGVDQVQTGDEMRIELGRGCCGSGFQDLSGMDPDVGANLVNLSLVDQSSPGSGKPIILPTGPDAVALLWSLDGGSVHQQSQASAVDHDYLYLERLTSMPIQLTAGQHMLNLDYGGSDPERSAMIDGFLLMPARLTRRFISGSSTLILTYDIDHGLLSIQEQ